MLTGALNHHIFYPIELGRVYNLYYQLMQQNGSHHKQLGQDRCLLLLGLLMVSSWLVDLLFQAHSYCFLFKTQYNNFISYIKKHRMTIGYK